jgi:PAS domain S-box-containing protein
LGTDHDPVSLSRRTRAAGDEFGLDARSVRSLSSATYEVARQLVAHGGVEAEVRLGDGPSLQVVFRIPLDTSAGPDPWCARLPDLLRPIEPMVDGLDVREQERMITICLRSMFPTEDGARGGRWPAQEASRVVPASADVPDEDLRQRYGNLEQAFHELQSELEETNRGVVALHADLETQAERLRQAEDRLRLLLDGVQDYAICMLTPAGEVASWNSGAERLFGYAAEEIVGRNFSCFYEAGERELQGPAEYLRRAEEHGRFAAECVQVRYGGTVFDAHVALTPVRRGRDLQGYSMVVRDITERKRLEEDLRRRAEELAAANRAKEDFLATLSHELRTPLNAMLGWTRLLRMGKLDQAAMARALETIERNAHIQEQLIADILDLSRIVTGKLRLELRPTELPPVVEAAIDAVRPAADAKGIALVSEIERPGTVLGDPDRLQQVVWNLLVNAVKFTPSEGRVTARLARSGPDAVIAVTDTGQGIAPDLLPFIFDRFTQGDASVTRRHGGLGLGLSIVRHIVELHGGTVEGTSDGAGTGATFTVRLPVRAIQQPGEAREQPGSQPLTGIKVLVVDDDPDARDVVSMALAQFGARTAAVGSAREALQLIPEFRPDVLVSDIGMPGEDGYSFIRRLRALDAEEIRDVPAVALTAYSQPEDRRRALLAGFQQFVPKPVEVDELAAVVRRLAESAGA